MPYPQRTIFKELTYDSFGNIIMGNDLYFCNLHVGLGFAGGDTNLYGYVLNDPVNFVDSSGLSPLSFLGICASGYLLFDLFLDSSTYKEDTDKNMNTCKLDLNAPESYKKCVKNPIVDQLNSSNNFGKEMTYDIFTSTIPLGQAGNVGGMAYETAK